MTGMNSCCFDKCKNMQRNVLFMLHIATCTQGIAVASIADVNNAHNCNINCKALERIILGKVPSSKQ